MNIFYLHPSPRDCASMHHDKHVVKMIIEYAQLLSTAHRMIDGELVMGLTKTGRKVKRYQLPDSRDGILYAATHANHPSAKWTRHSKQNYEWLAEMWYELLLEYTHRYGKRHKTEDLLEELCTAPRNIEDRGFSPPWRAMPDDAKIEDDSLLSYRNYYVTYKYKMARWTNRKAPVWFEDGIYKLYGDKIHTVLKDRDHKSIQQPTYKTSNANILL